MTGKRIGVLAGVAVLAAAGVVAGTAIAASSSGQPAAASAPAGAGASSSPGYSWYRAMMGRYDGGGPMMGGSSSGWLMSAAGYRWMLGGTGAPGWMRGGALPGSMMGSGADPGTVMGSLWADAPGPRVSPAEAARLGSQIPAGARVSRAARTITFTSRSVTLVALASPSMPAESFRIAGMTNPDVIVPAGARVSIELINADHDMAHGLVINAPGTPLSPVPMITATPAFGGAALWFLGEPTSAGMHAGTLSFTATRPGSYRYLCPVPGHAQEGMSGSFTVESTS